MQNKKKTKVCFYKSWSLQFNCSKIIYEKVVCLFVCFFLYLNFTITTKTTQATQRPLSEQRNNELRCRKTFGREMAMFLLNEMALQEQCCASRWRLHRPHANKSSSESHSIDWCQVDQCLCATQFQDIVS